jgi:hypothetical protein
MPVLVVKFLDAELEELQAPEDASRGDCGDGTEEVA